MSRFFKAIQDNARRFPASLAFIGANVVLNYRGLDQSINNIATKVLSLNIEPGSTVCVRCRNPNVELLTNLGLMRAGMTVAIATSPEIYADHNFVFDVLITDGVAVTGREYKARRGVRVVEDWSQPNQFSKRKIGEHPYALIFASSGSTGRNKLLLATQENMDYRYALKSDEGFFSGENLRFLSLNQPNSMTSLADVLITLIKGGQVVRLGMLPPDQSLDAVTVYQPTYVCMAPYTLVGMLDSLVKSRRRLKKADYLRVAGAYCAPEVRKKAKELLAENVATSYGATETGRMAFAEYDEIADIEGAVGKVVPGYEVEALDDAGNPVGGGASGELRMKPPAGSALTYLTRDGPVSPLKDGWFYPGDTGRVDENGVLIISGRKSNVINFGGNKLDPERIEAVIGSLEGVEDVAVAPLPGPDGFDLIHCLVKAPGSLQAVDVNKFVVSRSESFQLETVRQVASIPRTQGGKIDRVETLRLIRKYVKSS